MNYIPGNIDPKLQQKSLFVLLDDFVFCLINDRYDNIDLLDDSFIIQLPLKKGDIISLRLFKPSSTEEVYCYIDSVFVDGVEKQIKSESIFQKGHSVSGKSIFREPTVSELREIKLNSIIN